MDKDEANVCGKSTRGLVVFVLFGAVISIVYLLFAANGWCECIPLMGRIEVDKDPIRTAGVLFGTTLLLAKHVPRHRAHTQNRHTDSRDSKDQ